MMISRTSSTGGPSHHVPVMLREVLDTLALRGGNVYVDGTFGGGGHSKAILDSCQCNLLAIDRDIKSIEIGKELKEKFPKRIKFYNQSFSEIPDILDQNLNKKVDGVLLDLGISSLQLDNPKRGFSFQKDGPLDMRMANKGITASDVVNKLKEENLAIVIRDFGEERHSKIVAKKICEHRKNKKIESTYQLSEIIEKSIGWSYRKQKGKYIHPSTRTFQAIRILINQELEEIISVLPNIARYINTEGRVVIITFHSIEDRIVKNIFDDLTGQNMGVSRYYPERSNIDEKLFMYPNKKFLKPTNSEILENPRSRSAKLRCIERTKAIFRENLDIYSTNKYDKILSELR
jgi:16S rRNA (cytosine1402-N4)-methyltransferase|tara:strand:+ start:1051 stop:2091 length:1041 start_codon:yes stop_codon:yes gene_type:complete